MDQIVHTPREDAAAIRPFHPNFSDAAILDLRRRIEATILPERETVADASQGVQLATIQNLVRYWGENYDLRACGARLKRLPHFVTEIDGLDFHFIHVRSKHPGALPLIITHGWPGTLVQVLKIIDPLTNPTAHGASESDAFDVVIPSLPGYGFSAKPEAAGWGPDRIARAWPILMKRLGYTNFVAQGGDWGAIITELMAAQAPPGLLGIHTNMPNAVPAEIDRGAQSGAPAPSGLAADERRAYEQLAFVYKNVNYAYYMGSRPQTLVGLTDSPAGLAAFMLDFEANLRAQIARAFDGHAESLSRDDVLDNITLTWLTRTGVSSARLYWENKFAFFSPKGISLPVAVSVFPDELYQCPRSWAEGAYPRLVHYNRPPKGGHFPAWEQPKIFSDELRLGFRSLRSC